MFHRNVNGEFRACVQKGFFGFFSGGRSRILSAITGIEDAGRDSLILDTPRILPVLGNYAKKKGYSGTANFPQKKEPLIRGLWAGRSKSD